VQLDLADATGMSVIHLNRTLQHLRSRNLIGRAHSKLEIPGLGGAEGLGEFDPNYLQSRHPDRIGRLPLLGSDDQHALSSRPLVALAPQRLSPDGRAGAHG